MPNTSIFVFVEHNYTSLGKFNVTATAVNGSITGSDTITVKTKSAPSLTGIPDVTFLEDQYNDTVDLDDYASDNEDELSELSFTATGNSSDTVRVGILPNHVVNFSGAPDYNNEDGINITFTVTDTDDLTGNDTILVIIWKDNDPPAITWYTPEDLTPRVAENSELLFNHTSEDIDSPTLYYNWSLDGVTQSTNQSWSYIPATGTAGVHNVSLIVSDPLDLSDSQTWTVTVSNIDLYNLSQLYEDKTLRLFEFYIKNLGNYTLTDINWSSNTGLETISAKELISLQGNETAIVLFQYNYTQTGDYQITASATDSKSADEETINIDVEDIEASNLSILNISDTKAIFEFWITNYLAVSLTNISFQFDTDDGSIINSTKNINLTQDESIFIYLEYSFTSPGTYNVNATAINGTLKDSTNLTITV